MTLPYTRVVDCISRLKQVFEMIIFKIICAKPSPFAIIPTPRRLLLLCKMKRYGCTGTAPNRKNKAVDTRVLSKQTRWEDLLQWILTRTPPGRGPPHRRGFFFKLTQEQSAAIVRMALTLGENEPALLVTFRTTGGQLRKALRVLDHPSHSQPGTNHPWSSV